VRVNTENPLSDAACAQLQSLLTSRAAELTKSDTPFCFDLIRIAQDFLAESSDVVGAPGNSRSLYDSFQLRQSKANLALAIDATVPAQAPVNVAAPLKRNGANPQRRPNSPSLNQQPLPTPPTLAQLEGTPKSKSRYANDFEEISTVGRGGFGQVVKVRNRLDGMIYAVKKVKLSASSDEDNIKTLREVVHLARLLHPHIVRYFVGWVERDMPDEVAEPSTMVRSSSSFLSRHSDSAESDNSSEEEDDEEGDASGGFMFLRFVAFCRFCYLCD